MYGKCRGDAPSWLIKLRTLGGSFMVSVSTLAIHGLLANQFAKADKYIDTLDGSFQPLTEVIMHIFACTGFDVTQHLDPAPRGCQVPP